jgi:hypothetical protein
MGRASLIPHSSGRAPLVLFFSSINNLVAVFVFVNLSGKQAGKACSTRRSNAFGSQGHELSCLWLGVWPAVVHLTACHMASCLVETFQALQPGCWATHPSLQLLLQPGIRPEFCCLSLPTDLQQLQRPAPGDLHLSSSLALWSLRARMSC